MYADIVSKIKEEINKDNKVEPFVQDTALLLSASYVFQSRNADFLSKICGVGRRRGRPICALFRKKNLWSDEGINFRWSDVDSQKGLFRFCAGLVEAPAYKGPKETSLAPTMEDLRVKVRNTCPIAEAESHKKPVRVVRPTHAKVNEVSDLHRLHEEINKSIIRHSFDPPQWVVKRRFTELEWVGIIEVVEANNLLCVMRNTRSGYSLALDIMIPGSAPGLPPQGVIAIHPDSLPKTLIAEGSNESEKWDAVWDVFYPLVFTERNQSVAKFCGVRQSSHKSGYRY